jgi:large subunit ribosomal protein L4
MTLSLTIQNPNDAKASGGTIDLPAEIFDVELNIPLIHQVVVAQLAAARQGTASTKTRAEVRGGGKKPYRQKGTGRARQGSTRAPQFAGGGVVHGPKPRSYKQRTPKKMIAAALRGALSDRARHDRLHVVSSLVDGTAPSTKGASATLARISTAKRVLVVAERSDGVTWQSLRNVNEVHLLEPGQLNTYDVLISDEVVFVQSALESFLAGPVKGKSAKGAASSDEVDEAPAPVEVTKKPAKNPEATKPAASVASADEVAAVAEAPMPEVEAIEDGPDYGPDSFPPIEGGFEPDGFPIKGNASSMLYHVPGSAFYERTVPEVWFRTAKAAEDAGFQLPPSQREEES